MKKVHIVWTICLVVAVVLVLSRIITVVSSRPAKDGLFVRVRIANDREFVVVSSPSPASVIDPVKNEIIIHGVDLADGVRVSAERNAIICGTEVLPFRRIRLSPAKGGTISTGGRAYRGEFDIILTDDGLDVVNIVGMEDYLKGVVPSEMNSFWPSSALKAQAIASRSFALWRCLKRKNKDYDVTDDTFSQVYKGVSGENWRTTRAVADTRGLVLEYDGKVLPAYFHSCCGGHTENAGEVWNHDLPPLKGVKCPWCRWSPYYRWQVRIPPDRLQQGLKAEGYDVKKIEDIREGEGDASGRMKEVSVRTRDGWFRVPVNDMRRGVGTKYLKSTKFKIKKYPRFFLFNGYGWGHGVGMCQWGAFGLALRWRSAEFILKYYYPGAKIVPVEKILSQ